jgi:hypothetical protein
MRNQRIQDFFFHKITLLFAALVLAGAGRHHRLAGDRRGACVP